VTEAAFISWALDPVGSGQMGGLAGTAGVQSIHAPDQSGLSDWARPVNLPGIARNPKANPRTIWALYWPHGQCDPRNEVRRVAATLDLGRYRYGNDGYVDVDAKLKGIRLIPSQWPRGSGRGQFWGQHAELVSDSGEYWDYSLPLGVEEIKRYNALRANRRPNGWYPRARGSTHFWGEYYAKGLPHRYDNQWPCSPENETPRRAFLMVVCATWCYEMTWKSRPTRDFETLIAFSVFCNAYPYMSELEVNTALKHPLDEQAPNDLSPGRAAMWAELRSYRLLAENLAKQIYDYLRQHLSEADALGFRLTLAQDRSEQDTAPRAPSRHGGQGVVMASADGAARVLEDSGAAGAQETSTQRIVRLVADRREALKIQAERERRKEEESQEALKRRRWRFIAAGAAFVLALMIANDHPKLMLIFMLVAGFFLVSEKGSDWVFDKLTKNTGDGKR
jgi:hypothetical protein